MSNATICILYWILRSRLLCRDDIVASNIAVTRLNGLLCIDFFDVSTEMDLIKYASYIFYQPWHTYHIYHQPMVLLPQIVLVWMYISLIKSFWAGVWNVLGTVNLWFCKNASALYGLILSQGAWFSISITEIKQSYWFLLKPRPSIMRQ